MSSPGGSQSPKPARKIHKSDQENVAQQHVPQGQGSEASVPASGHIAMAAVSHGHRGSTGEPSWNMNSSSASVKASEHIADTSVRLPDNCEKLPLSISQLKELLQTIGASIGANHPTETSSTGILAQPADLTMLLEHIQRVERPVLDLEAFIIQLLDSAPRAAHHVPIANMGAPQHNGFDDIVDQSSPLSLGSDRLNDFIETVENIDEDQLLPTVDNLIGAVACIAEQLEHRNDYRGAQVFRGSVTRLLQEVRFRAHCVLEAESPPEPFTDMDMDAIDAVPEPEIPDATGPRDTVQTYTLAVP